MIISFGWAEVNGPKSGWAEISGDPWHHIEMCAFVMAPDIAG